MKTVAIILAVPLFLIASYFILSIISFQRLINEGSALADEQCFKVNPILIEKKNAYIRQMSAAKANNTDEFVKEMDNYFVVSRKLVLAQKSWLDAQKAYMDRWDFQYFIPQYMKDAAITQFAAQDADRQSTQYLINSYEVYQLNESLAQELGEKAMEQIKIRNAADKKYDELWDTPRELDWRTRFIKVPASKCSDENFDIPDIEDFLNPGSAPTNPDAPLS